MRRLLGFYRKALRLIPGELIYWSVNVSLGFNGYFYCNFNSICLLWNEIGG